ncbi:MAG: hypothetical protein M1536_03870 [Firmicutes bacterium]|nr:hypothetical protein [Bacillota bacterium]
MKFSMSCSCGEAITVDALDRDDAVKQVRGIMSKEMVAKHMTEKHPGEAVPSQEQVQIMISQSLHAADKVVN